MSSFNYDLKDRWGIYQIRNIKTGSIYIGKSQDIYKRWNEHIRNLIRGEHHCPNLQAEFNQYGRNAFEFSVIEFQNIQSKTRLWFREQYNIFDCEHEGELLNVPCNKDREIYELAKLLRQERIPFTLKTKMGNNTMDIVIYSDEEKENIKKIVDVFEYTTDPIRSAQIDATEKKHRDYCKNAEIEYMCVEPDDGWFTRDEIIH